jgi:putative spermidine/putrescine transport system permease protein
MSWLDRPACETQITHKQRLWLYLFTILALLFLVAPTLIVIPMSFSDSQYLEFPPRIWSTRWYQNYFASGEWVSATMTSLQAACLTTLIATPLGTLAAYGLYVCGLRLAHLVFILLVTPMMVPVILIAIGAFYVFVKLNLVYTLTGVVLAHSIMAIPLVLIVVSAGLKSYDMNQEMVARSLGASRFRAVLLITLPQIRFALITGALLAFLTSFDEVIIALFVSGGDNATLTRNMFISLRDQIDPTIASISTIMIMISCSLLALAQLFGKSARD